MQGDIVKIYLKGVLIGAMKIGKTFFKSDLKRVFQALSIAVFQLKPGGQYDHRYR